jgi:hypothetical protein
LAERNLSESGCNLDNSLLNLFLPSVTENLPGGTAERSLHSLRLVRGPTPLQITICPSAASPQLPDQSNFYDRDRHGAVSTARFDVNGEASCDSGVAFSDYVRMQTQTRRQSVARRRPVPSWALNDSMLQKVVCEYLLQRASLGPHLHAAFAGETAGMSPLEKLRFAENIIRSRIPQIEVVLDRLAEEYVQLKRTGIVTGGKWTAAQRLKKLESQIEGLDTSIIISRSAGALVTAVVYYYHRERLDSVGTANRVGLKPPGCRQLLFRLSLVAESLGLEPKRSDLAVRRHSIEERREEKRRRKEVREEQKRIRAEERARIREEKEEQKRIIRAAEKASRPPRAKKPTPEERRAAGLCRCGEAPSAGYTTCQPCRDVNQRYSDRYLARKKAAVTAA